MAISLLPGDGLEDPTATAVLPEELQPVAPGPAVLPRSDAPPSTVPAFGENPLARQQREEDARMLEFFRTGTATVDQAYLDPDNFFKGDDLSGVARDLNRAKVVAANDLALRLYNGGKDAPTSGLTRRLALKQAALEMFDGQGGDSEEEFHGQMVKAATTRKEASGIADDLQTRAATIALSQRSGDGDGYLEFQMWRKQQFGKPGYDVEKEGDYLEQWQRAYQATQDHIAPFSQQLARVTAAMKSDEGAAAAKEVYLSLPADQRQPFLQAVGTFARALPAKAQTEFMANMAREAAKVPEQIGGAMERGFLSIGQSQSEDALAAKRRGTRELGPMQSGFNETTEQQIEGQISKTKDRRAQLEFAGDVAAIQDNVYRPVQTDPDIAVPASFQRLLYKQPELLSAVAVGAVPYAGPVALYAMARGNAYTAYRNNFLQTMPEEEASAKADSLAAWEAVPDTVLQLAGSKILKGGLPFLEKWAQGAINRVGGGLAGRYATRFAITAAEETAVATGQGMVNPLFQSFAAATDPKIPGVQWTGEKGVLHGAWSQIPETFASLAPLVGFGSLIGARGDAARARAFAEAPDLHLEAMGVSPENIAGIRDAASKGIGPMNAAIDQAMTKLDPRSPGAQAATEKLRDSFQRTATALQESQAMADMPVLTRDGETGDWLVHAEGSGEFFRSPNRVGAMRLAGKHFEAMKDLESSHIAYMSSLMEAADEAAKLQGDKPKSIEVNLGKVFTEAMAGADPAAAERYAKQVRNREIIAGGDGSFAGNVLGSHSVEIARGMRQSVIRLYDGADATTVFHEDWHRLRQEATERGDLTRADDLAFVRAYDNVLQGKSVRSGGEARTPLRLLPEGIADEHVTSEMLDEAVAEIAQSEVLKSRRSGRDNQNSREGVMQLPSGFLTRNLTAIARLAPDATRKFTAFLDAVRARWGLTLGRALALKKAEKAGTFDTTTRDAYLAKLFGTTEQNAHDSAADRATREILDGTTDPSRYADFRAEGDPFSIGNREQRPVLSEDLKTSFSKSPYEHTFEPANENRPGILEIARELGIELVRPGQVSADLGTYTRRIQEALGVETLFFRGSAERGLLGFNPRGNPDLVFLSTDPARRDIPLAWPLAHELLHVAQKDGAARANDLLQFIQQHVTPDELATMHELLDERGYKTEDFPTELPAFLVGDAISGKSVFALDDLEKAPEIQAEILRYFDSLQALKPSSLKDVSDDDLASSFSIGDDKAGPVLNREPGFFSKLEQVAEAKLPASASPEQVLATIDPARGSGVKAEEIKWSGLEDAVRRIAAENGGKVPKAALLDHLRNEGAVRFSEAVSRHDETALGNLERESELARNAENEARFAAFDILDAKGIGQVQRLNFVEALGRGAKGEEYQRALKAGRDLDPSFDWESLRTLSEAADKAEKAFRMEKHSSPRYDEYVLPGGEHYREVVLTLPDGPAYTSSHFDAEGYVAHMRLDERADAAGRPGLFIEEIQSDRHQAGREKGYTQDRDALVRDFHGISESSWARLTPIERSRLGDDVGTLQPSANRVADAPFRKDWPLQMFKRALRDAVASGKEWIGWTDGDTQNARFDLSKQVQEIQLYREGGGFNIEALEHGRDNPRLVAMEVPVGELGNYIGKELAARVAAEPTRDHNFKGDGLKIEGQGMKGFYDQILPSEIGKYVKKWGAKVEPGTVKAEGETPMWKVDITPEMAASVKEGQTVFAISHSEMAGRVLGDAVSRIKDPVRRVQAMSRIAKSTEALRLQAERLELLMSAKRQRKSLQKEASVRQALRQDELERQAYATHWGILSNDDLVKLKAQPGHAFLADPQSPLRGRLKSKTQAIKQHPDLFKVHNAGDYDGSEGVSRSVFGGDLMPDQAAQEMFDAGLIREPSTDAMWTLLQKESQSVAGMKEALTRAQADIRAAKGTAIAETNDWLKSQVEQQDSVYSDKEEIRRTLELLDGILGAVPAQIRGKVGGYTQLAKLGTNEARLKFLQDRLAKVDKHLEDWMRVQYDADFRKILDRAQPKKAEPGEKPRGTIGADVHDLFQSVRDAMTKTAAEAEADAVRLESLAGSGDYTAAQEAHMIMEAQMVRLAGDWGHKDAAGREMAVIEASRIFDTGYLDQVIKVSRQREVDQTRRSRFIADTGKRGTEKGRKIMEDYGREKLGATEHSFLSILGFEQAAGWVFGDKSAEADRLAGMELASHNRKTDALQSTWAEIEDLFVDLAGGARRFDRFTADAALKGQLLRRKLAEVRQDTTRKGQPRKPKGIKGTNGVYYSQLEAIAATLMWRQDDGRRHMLGHVDEAGRPVGSWHYDQKFVDSLEAGLSEQAKGVRLYLMEKYAAEYDRLNPIFRELNGVNLPRNKNYSPLVVEPVKGTNAVNLDPVTNQVTNGATFTPGSLKTRGQAVAEPQFRDALQTFQAHTIQMEHWMAYAPFATEASRLLDHRDVRNSVAEKAGVEAVKTLRSWIELFGRGGTNDAASHLASTKAINKALNHLASVALIGRVSVLAVQATQLGAAANSMPVGSYVKRMAKLTTGQLGWGDAIASPYIQRRLREMPPVVRQALAGLSTGTPNHLKHQVQRIGQLIGGADALFTAGTYAMVFDYQKTVVAKDLRLKGAEAEAFAHAAAEREVDKVAQPMRMGARSLFENTSTNPAMKLAWAFASEPRQKMALMVYAAAKQPMKQKLRAVAQAYFFGGVMSSIIRAAVRDSKDSGDELFDERNWNPKLLALQTITSPLKGIPFLGDAVEGGLYKAFHQYLPEGNLFSVPVKAVESAVHLGSGKSSGADAVLKDTEAIISGFGVGSENAAAGASVLHVLRDLFSIGENATGN